MTPRWTAALPAALLLLAGCGSAGDGGTGSSAVASPARTESAGASPGDVVTTSAAPQTATATRTATATATRTATATATATRTATATATATRTPSATVTITATPRPSPWPTSWPGAGQLEPALEAALADAVEVAVMRALEEAGLGLVAVPDCRADLDLDRAARAAEGTVSCTGTTTAGLPMTATFTGSATVGGSCEGRLQVSVAGRGIMDESVDVCR